VLVVVVFQIHFSNISVPNHILHFSLALKASAYIAQTAIAMTTFPFRLDTTI
jgi:hypothetical protein